jgi:hypothetical protein
MPERNSQDTNYINVYGKTTFYGKRDGPSVMTDILLYCAAVYCNVTVHTSLLMLLRTRPAFAILTGSELASDRTMCAGKC